MRFRVKAGTHSEPDEDGNLVRYGKGEEVESDRDLSKIFMNKFEKLSDTAPAVVKKARKAAEEEAEDGDEDDEDVVSNETRGVMDNPNKDTLSGVASKLGVNVSEDFELAKEAELLVLKKKGKFFIAEPESADTPLNEDAFISKAEVNKALKKYIKG